MLTTYILKKQLSGNYVNYTILALVCILHHREEDGEPKSHACTSKRSREYDVFVILYFYIIYIERDIIKEDGI